MYLVTMKVPPIEPDAEWPIVWAGVVDDYQTIFSAYADRQVLLSSAWLHLERD